MIAALQIRPALRALRREPGLVAGVVLTMALAIGVTATMLDLVTRLMLAPPSGVTNPDRVARFLMDVTFDGGQRFTMSTTSYPTFRAIAARNDVLASAAAVRASTIVIGAGDDAKEIKSIAASGAYFTTLGATPSLGRLFGPADDELPAGSAVVVLNHAFWKRQFNADAGIVGRDLTLAGIPYTVVGVAAPDFSGDNVSQVDVFIPLSASMRASGASWASDPYRNLVTIIARLRDGVSAEQAAAAATSVVQSRADDRGRMAVVTESLVPTSVRSSTQSRIAVWLTGVSILVLLIATANISTLLVLRAVRKRRDAAVRIALGAGRAQLGVHAIVESLLLAAGGAFVGLLLSKWLGDAARVTLLPDLAPTERLLDARVFVVAVALALAAGIAAAVGPLFLMSRYSLTGELYGSGTLGSARQSRTQRALIGVQVALCAVLLVGAGLFVRSLQRVQSQDLGFSTDHLLYTELSFRDRPPGRERDAAYSDAIQRLRQTPGVAAVSATQAMPFGSFHVPPISVPELDHTPTVNGQPPFLYASTPEFLDMMNVRVVKGRLFTASDLASGAPLVVLVNETFAREVWPGQEALGRCVRAGHDPFADMDMLASPHLPCRTVVGVVRDSRARSIRPTGREASLMQYYVPFTQTPAPPFAPDYSTAHGILMRVSGDVDRMSFVVQRAIQSTSSVPVFAKVQRYQDLLDPQMRPWRLGAALFVAFGILAVCITAVGLFGMISYLVAQRTREIGLRLALGGSTAGIGGSVIWSALRTVGVGVGAGLAIALVSGRYVADLLFETSPADAGVLAVSVFTFLAVTLLAAAWPAWRASRVSPMVALRSD